MTQTAPAPIADDQTDGLRRGAAAGFALSVCICTRNRPDALRDAIHSVLESRRRAHEIIVSDDSTDDRTRVLIEVGFQVDQSLPPVILVQGPRRGLGANRNVAIRHARGSHILFIDDDVKLSADFIDGAAAMLGQAGGGADGGWLILSGTEISRGEHVFPHRPSFLGYQALEYRPDDRRETVVINAAIFPRTVFARVGFDENLVYGCDEVDLTVRAVHLHGFRIALAPALTNFHFPSEINREFYAPYGEASRIYVTYKRYRWVERRPVKALLYLAIAYGHILLHDLKSRRLGGFTAFRITSSKSMSYIRACAASPARYV